MVKDLFQRIKRTASRPVDKALMCNMEAEEAEECVKMVKEEQKTQQYQLELCVKEMGG